MRVHEEITIESSVLSYIVEILKDITAEWDIAEITGNTSLGGLGLESINLVYLIAEIQQRFALGERLFNQLRASAINVTDLGVSQLATMVCDILMGRNLIAV